MAATVLWPLKPDVLSPYAPWSLPVWFGCMGMAALSVGRFHGKKYPIPAPELFLFLYPFCFTLFFGELRQLKIQAFDEYLLAFDHCYGYFEMNIGRCFHRAHFFGCLIRLLYFSLAFAQILLFLVLPSKAAQKNYIKAAALPAIILLPMYAACPGAGPLYLLRTSFPWAIPDLSHPHVRLIPNAELNTTPSGHFAWALLISGLLENIAVKPCNSFLDYSRLSYALPPCLRVNITSSTWCFQFHLPPPFGRWSIVNGASRPSPWQWFGCGCWDCAKAGRCSFHRYWHGS